MASNTLEIDELLNIYRASSGYRPQFEHRVKIVKSWNIVPGSRVLEIGPGQGDCTIVLATAVGESGHVDAVDPAPLDYGTLFPFLYLRLNTPHSPRTTSDFSPQAPPPQSANPKRTYPPPVSDLASAGSKTRPNTTSPPIHPPRTPTPTSSSSTPSGTSPHPPPSPPSSASSPPTQPQPQASASPNTPSEPVPYPPFRTC